MNIIAPTRDSSATIPENQHAAGDKNGVAVGLVYSETTGQTILIDKAKARLKGLKCSVLNAARLHTEELQATKSRYTSWMVTLTYSPYEDWQPDQIKALARHYRRWFKTKKVIYRYVWVMELTKAGAPHYHVLLWLPKGITPLKPDKQGWWPFGMTRVEKVRNAVGYAAKYASKGTDGTAGFPQGARIHGSGGLSLPSRRQKAWWRCPAYIRDIFPCFELGAPSRAAGGGWRSNLGEWIPSRYEVVKIQPLTIIERQGWAEMLKAMGIAA